MMSTLDLVYRFQFLKIIISPILLMNITIFKYAFSLLLENNISSTGLGELIKKVVSELISVRIL